MLETQERPPETKRSVHDTEEKVELASADIGMRLDELTPILGYSTAGSSPSKTLWNVTMPEYSACVADCRRSRVERDSTRVTGTIPDCQLLPLSGSVPAVDSPMQ